MIVTIDVEPQVKDHVLWFLNHLDKGVTILSEEDDTLFSEEELRMRNQAMEDLKKGDTISEEDFAKEFFDDL